MNAKPNKWVAAALALLLPTIGMLNVAQPTWAAVYFFAVLMMGRQFSQDEHLPVAAAIALALAVRVGAAIHAYRLAVQYPPDKPRPAYSRGPVAVGIYAVLVCALLGVPFVLGLIAQASCVGATCK